jgi:hypothetical protein
MLRIVESEILDSLPSEDPRALRSRADLRRLNRVMGHAAILDRALAPSFPSFANGVEPARICELGAGDGSLALALARRWRREYRAATLTLVDRLPTSTAQRAIFPLDMDWTIQWVTADVREWLAGSGSLVDLILANLFLHHFRDDDLQDLLAMVSGRTRVFIACEPRRTPRTLLASRLVGLLGCNSVTRHDAVVSVRAGFNNHDLSALWPPSRDWTTREFPAGMFSHCFVARRQSSETQ